MNKKKHHLSYLIIIVSILIIFTGCKTSTPKSNNLFFTDLEKEELGITDKSSIEIFSNPLLTNQYFVKVIENNNWFESIYRVVVDGNHKQIESLGLDGIIEDFNFYTERDSVKLPDKYLPLVLAISYSSHMGNGPTNLYVFTTEGDMEELLCAESTVDANLDTASGIIYQNRYLNLHFQDTNNGGEYNDIVFSGDAYQYGVAENPKDNPIGANFLYQTLQLERIYSYDQKQEKYVEKSNNEKVIQTMDGVMSYHEYWEDQAKNHRR
ncbi:hypothetical protein [Anaerosporobacter sp.]